ncbi:hypothetical protein ABPG72_004467 [Tetrahymena utriculariae]
MRKTSQSVSQPQSSYKQKQPDQQGVLREGEKLTAEQIKEFLHESRQNSECSNFDETINNQQKMEKIMIKQNFLEINQLFDPIQYFGGLKVKDLNQKVDDQRLSDMFKIQTEENNTEKSDLVSYHVKNVQQSLMSKNQEQLKNQNWIDKDKQIKTYYFNENQNSILLGYSQQQQQSNKYTKKFAQSPSQQQLIKQNSFQSCDKENFSVVKQSSLQQKGASFNYPVNSTISQTLQQNFSSLTQTQEPSNSNQILNITPLKQLSQNVQFSLASQQGYNIQLNNSKINKKEPDMMISPDQITKQKLSQQNNTGNPLIFSFQLNGTAVNGLSFNSEVLKNPNSSLEQQHKVFNNKSAQQSTNQTPSKQNHTTKDVKIACIPNDTSPSSHKVVACKPLSQKKEGDQNRIQLLQAVEQINIDSQRKNSDSSCSSSVTPKHTTPSNKVQKNDYSKMNISNTLKQENTLSGKNSQISQQHAPSLNNAGDNLSLNNQAKNSHTDKMLINDEYSSQNQFQSQQEHKDEIEFYDQSNWQSVQQISQNFQSVENNSNGQFYNTQNAINKNCNASPMQDGFINIKDNAFSQKNNSFQTLSKSSQHHRSQSKMFEQKQTSEQFFKDKENLELTFQEETANNEEQQSETEFNCKNLHSSLNQIQRCSNAAYTQFQQEVTHSPEKNHEEISLCQNNLYNKIASMKHNNVNQLKNYRNNLGQELEQQVQLNDNPSQQFKKQKEKSKSMIQGELTNQKSSLNQNQYSSRNNSREIQKKNSYFVQRQMNTGVTTNKLKSFIASNTPQNSIMNASTKGKTQDNSQLGRFNYSSNNNSKMSSSILLQEKSLIISEKPATTYISTLQNTNNILQNSNIQEKQPTQSYTQQYQTKQQIANLPSKINQYKKSSSQTSSRKDNFLSPKVSQRNTPRSNSQYSSIDNSNTNQSQSTSNAYQSKRGHNKSQPNLCIQPLSNSNIQSNSQTKINYGICQNLQNYTTNILNNNVLQNNTSSGVNNYISSAVNSATTNQLANITSSQNSQMTNGILSSLSSTYLKRPSGKSIQYDYKSISNQANNQSKNRLASSPTHSPNNYKIKQSIITNSNQTLRQKKLMGRLEQNTSKHNSQALSFRDQQTNHLNIYASNTGNTSTKISSNQSNLLQSINVNSGKYNPDQFDKDLKYNIAVEAKKTVFKIDPKYEESLNHLMSMQVRHQNTSQSSLYINQNQLSQGNFKQFTTTQAIIPSIYQTNNTSNKNQIQNYQK